jgi:hypothetical protein
MAGNVHKEGFKFCPVFVGGGIPDFEFFPDFVVRPYGPFAEWNII